MKVSENLITAINDLARGGSADTYLKAKSLMVGTKLGDDRDPDLSATAILESIQKCAASGDFQKASSLATLLIDSIRNYSPTKLTE